MQVHKTCIIIQFFSVTGIIIGVIVVSLVCTFLPIIIPVSASAVVLASESVVPVGVVVQVDVLSLALLHLLLQLLSQPHRLVRRWTTQPELTLHSNLRHILLSLLLQLMQHSHQLPILPSHQMTYAQPPDAYHPEPAAYPAQPPAPILTPPPAPDGGYPLQPYPPSTAGQPEPPPYGGPAYPPVTPYP